LAALTAGCASTTDYATFVTKTSLAFVEADTTPAGLSFGFDRVEGYVGPRFEDGCVAPVVGYVETRGEGITRDVKQVYATGQAAVIVTHQGTGTPPPNNGKCPPADKAAVKPASAASAASSPPVAAQEPKGRPALFFATGTVIGIKIGFLESSPVPNAFTFGYKRKEMSVIPVEGGHTPSVLATHDSGKPVPATQAAAASSPAATAPATSTAAAAPAAAGAPTAAALQASQIPYGVVQYFATGAAADAMAAYPGIKDAFKSAARDAVGEFREADREQLRHANAVLGCLAALDDTLLPKVLLDAEQRDLIFDADILKDLKASNPPPSAQQKRSLYTDVIIVRRSNDPKHIQNLDLHRSYVCGLAQR